MASVSSPTVPLFASFWLAVASSAMAQSPSVPAPVVEHADTLVTVVGCIVRDGDHGSQLNAASQTTGATVYSLNGVREREIARHVGRRLELTGRVEPQRTVGVTSPADALEPFGSTSEGSASHEPGSAQPAAAGAPPQPLPRLNVASYRPVGGGCVDMRGRTVERTSTPAGASPPAPPAARALTTKPVQATSAEARSTTVIGCLLRQTPGGPTDSALDAQSPDALVLMQTTSAESKRPAITSAVPASIPASSGTGTVPTPTVNAAKARVAPAPSFVLATDDADQARHLGSLVGQRVEIVGTITGEDSFTNRGTSVGTSGRVEPMSASAHPSAPTRSMRVTSFRGLGGTCR